MKYGVTSIYKTFLRSIAHAGESSVVLIATEQVGMVSMKPSCIVCVAYSSEFKEHANLPALFQEDPSPFQLTMIGHSGLLASITVPSLGKKGVNGWIGGWVVEMVNVPYIMIAQLHLGSIF